MTINSTTTLAAQDNIAQLFDTDDIIDVSHTLNAYYNVTATPPTALKRRICAYTIGISGVVDRRVDACRLYQPIPFIARTLDDDLTLEERKGYYLRHVKQINGVLYVFYYGKQLSYIGTPQVNKYLVTSGTLTPTTYTTPDIFTDYTGYQSTQGMVSVSREVRIVLTNLEMTQITAACTLLGITTPVIREIGIVKAHPTLLTTNITELYSAIHVHQYVLGTPIDASTGDTRTFQIGASIVGLV